MRFFVTNRCHYKSLILIVEDLQFQAVAAESGQRFLRRKAARGIGVTVRIATAIVGSYGHMIAQDEIDLYKRVANSNWTI